MKGTFIDLGWMKVPFIHHHRAHFPQPGYERPSDFAGALPPGTVEDVLASLERCGLVQSVAELRAL